MHLHQFGKPTRCRCSKSYVTFRQKGGSVVFCLMLCLIQYLCIVATFTNSQSHWARWLRHACNLQGYYWKEISISINLGNHNFQRDVLQLLLLLIMPKQKHTWWIIMCDKKRSCNHLYKRKQDNIWLFRIKNDWQNKTIIRI